MESKLSQKDIALIKATYRKLSEAFYQNNNPQSVSHLMCLLNITKNCIMTVAEPKQLSIGSVLQILKAKSKSVPQLSKKTEELISYLSNPQNHGQKNNALLQGFTLGRQCPQLYTLSCTILMRMLRDSPQLITQETIGVIGSNCVMNVALSVELLLLMIEKKNQSILKVAIKSGMMKYILNTYLLSVTESRDKLSLYRALKLLKIATNLEKNIVKERQKSLANVIFQYEQYTPIVKEILISSYESQYSQIIISNITHPLSAQLIDKLYLWSHNQNFAQKLLSSDPSYVSKIAQMLKGQINAVNESKVYAILANICKFNKGLVCNGVSFVPKNELSLKNCLKLALTAKKQQVNIADTLVQLQKMVERSSDAIVPKLFSSLMNIMGHQQKKVRHLDQSKLDMFSEKNAQMLIEQASQTPSKKEDLENLLQILSAKIPKNEFEADCVNKAKGLAIESLLQCILVHGNKLLSVEEINKYLENMVFSNVTQANRMMQLLQIYLIRFPQCIHEINSKRICQIVKYLQDESLHSKDRIDWGACQQVLTIIYGNEKWKQQSIFRSALVDLTHCFWMLTVDSPNDINQIINSLKKIDPNNPKFLMLVGFLSKGSPQVRSQLLKQLYSSHLSKLIDKKIIYPDLYQLCSFVILNWCEQKGQIKQIIQKSFIPSIFKLMATDQYFNNSQQACIFLTHSLPLKPNPYSYSSLNWEQLLWKHGQLSYDIYNNMQGVISNGNIYQSLKLLLEEMQVKQRINPQSILTKLYLISKLEKISQKDTVSMDIYNISSKLQKINHKYAYWKIYPYYMDIILHLLDIFHNNLKSDNNKVRKEALLGMQKVIGLMVDNEEVSEEEYQQIFNRIIQYLNEIYTVKDKNILKNINIAQYRQIANKVRQSTLKNQLTTIINNIEAYLKQNDNIKNISPQKQHYQQHQKQLSQLKSQKPQASNIIAQETITLPQSTYEDNQNIEKQTFNSKNINIYSQLKIQENMNQNDLSVLEAIKILKLIVQGKQRVDILPKLLTLFKQYQIIEKYRDILGYLLSKVYQLSQNNFIIQLLLNKQKTTLNNQSCYALLSKYPQTFVVSRRWKLFSREWLILAVQRMSYKPFASDAYFVAEYNLPKISDVQFFQSKKYHIKLFQLFNTLTTVEQIGYYLLLVGTSCRLNDIRLYYLSKNMPTMIIKLINKYSQHTKILTNGSFALSAMIYLNPGECFKLVSENQDSIDRIFNGYSNHSKVKSVVQAGSTLLGNLTYSNDQVKCILYKHNIIELLIKFYVDNMNDGVCDTYKHILRGFGNCSTNKQCGYKIIDGGFGKWSMKLIEKFQFLIFLDQNKMKVLKLLIDVFANLTIHKYQLGKLHTEGITEFVVTLLQTNMLNSDVIMGCIDTVDGLCQDDKVQSYAIKQKNLFLILIDILKTQQNEKVITKSIRLLTNLTIHGQFIPIILEANLLSILANIVLRSHNNKKIEMYVNKIIARVYNSQQPHQLLLKSGYFDCVVRAMEIQDLIDDMFVDILLFYAKLLPNFLNKRTFICLIKLLTTKPTNKEIISKCIDIFKILLSMSIDNDQQDVVVEGSPKMYEILLSSYPIDIIYLLGSHCIRSRQLRLLLRKSHSHVVQFLTNENNIAKMVAIMNEQQKQSFLDMVQGILFIIYNQQQPMQIEITPQQEERAFTLLKNGFKCKLFRNDGSSKKAIVDINDDYEIRSYKIPNGQIKRKYMLSLRQIKDWHFYFNLQSQQDQNLWKHSVFSKKAKAFFNQEEANPSNCLVILGGSKWGEFITLNLQFQSIESKGIFIMALSTLKKIFN